MRMLTIRKGFKAFECKFEPFERDSKHLKVIRSILIQILTIREGFEAFESKSKHSNSNSNHSKVIGSILMQIRTIRKGFEAFECIFKQLKRDLKRSNANSNHSKGTRSIQMQIATIQEILSIQLQMGIIEKGFIAFECKFEPFKRDSKHSNANSNNSKGIRSIRMQIRTIIKTIRRI